MPTVSESLQRIGNRIGEVDEDLFFRIGCIAYLWRLCVKEGILLNEKLPQELVPTYETDERFTAFMKDFGMSVMAFSKGNMLLSDAIQPTYYYDSGEENEWVKQWRRLIALIQERNDLIQMVIVIKEAAHANILRENVEEERLKTLIATYDVRGDHFHLSRGAISALFRMILDWSVRMQLKERESHAHP